MTQPDKLYGLDIPYDKSVDELIELTREQPPLCWSAYTALAYNKTDKAIEALNSLLTNRDWTHIRSAIEAVGNNENGLKLEDKLLNFLDNKQQFVVTATIKALSKLRSAKAHDKIKDLTKSNNAEISKTAIKALSDIWVVADFDYLLDLDSQTQNQDIRKAIGFTLADHVDKSNWNTFFNHYRNDSIARHREWSLCFAGEFAGDNALVASYLKDKDGHIRKRAQTIIEPTKSA